MVNTIVGSRTCGLKIRDIVSLLANARVIGPKVHMVEGEERWVEITTLGAVSSFVWKGARLPYLSVPVKSYF